MSDALSFKEIDLNTHSQLGIWMDFLANSPQASCFFEPHFFKNFSQENRCFLIQKNHSIKAIFFGLTENAGKNLVFKNGAIHSGFLFSGEILNLKSKSKKNSQIYEISNFIAEQLPNYFETIDFCLIPEIVDIRPFQWFNYHSKNIDEKYKITTRYTSFLNLKSLVEYNAKSDDWTQNLSTLRRREIRKGFANSFHFEESKDIEAFLLLYKQAASNYMDELENEIQSIRMLFENYQDKLKLYFLYSEKKELVTANLFSFGFKKAHFLYGASNKKIIEAGMGSYAMWKSIESLKKLELQVLDFEGINSPERGRFKLSFGGDLIAYYRIQYYNLTTKELT
ncbi:MAG: hypothetical protein CL674_16865 [Bdellovibrionaceae bacterium]|nr:hypothetical protein [Pseudobdellovibrionaceae bacterium]|tara:strand:- start:54010 stop:55023 length:1014 start_codon:yes stop_codon:yes gene_type:complete